MKKPKISVQIEQEELDRYLAFCKTAGKSLSEWVRETLNAASKAPLALPPSQEKFVSPLEAPPEPENETHPCYHLKRIFPTHLKAADCQGTCNAPTQRGKVCHFAPSYARQCSAFELHRNRKLG